VIRFAEVVVVMMDFDAAFETQDLRIADLAEREGRAVVIAISKWDLVEDKNARIRELRETFERMLPQLKGTPVVQVSALTGRGVDRLREAIVEMHRVWNTRVTTAKLNQWLIEVVDQHPPPAASPSAQLRRLVLAPRLAAGELCALSGQRAASGLRAEGRADPAGAEEE
jgi:GTP-binding protein